MDIVTLGAAIGAAKKNLNNVVAPVTSADAGKIATVDSNGKYQAAALTVGQGEVAVDTTLLVSGAAADAKVTGDKVADLKSANNDYDILSLSLMQKHNGNLSTTKTWNNINSNYQHNVIGVNGGDTVFIKANSQNLYYGLLTDYVTPVNGASVPYSSDTVFNTRKTLAANSEIQFTVPNDTKFIVLVTVYGGYDTMPSILTINGYVYTENAKYNILKAMGSTDRLKWIAMGDSITMGYYSSIDGGTPAQHFSQSSTWAPLMAEKKSWMLNNVAVGATGYLYRGSDGTGKNSFEVATDIDFTKFDIVTLAYGINDWKGSVPTGSISDDITNPTTMISGMRKTIEMIMSSNPNIKIVVITPLNCRGYEFAYGDFSTNYALGYSMANSGTLQTAYDAIKSVCEYYGLFMVDETHSSAVNRLNIITALPDGVHPSLDAHKVLAHEIAGKIAYI